MFKILFQVIINIIITIIQIVVLPINLVIENLLPDFADKIEIVTSGLENLFTGVGFAIDILPEPFLECLIFVYTFQLALISVFFSVHTVDRVFELIKEIKFW